MDPELPVQALAGVGSYYLSRLKRLDIKTLGDLIYHFPFRYEDFTNVSAVEDIKSGEKTSIVGSVQTIKNIRTKRGKMVTIAQVSDGTSPVEVIWFNQPYLAKTLSPGTNVSLSGKAEVAGFRVKLISPAYEIVRTPLTSHSKQPTTLHTGRLISVYPETEGLSSRWLRTRIAKYLPFIEKRIVDFIPEEILGRQKLIPLSQALNKIHFPENFDEVELARKRLSFDELFLLQLLAQIRKLDWQNKQKAPKITVDEQKIKKLIASLPFELTKAQERASEQILSDLKKDIPANRLLEGDVGSGKTVVAAIAAYAAFENGLDVLLAAPTEILTFQHQTTLNSILSPFGINVGIWTKSKKIQGNITCGTHALLSSFSAKKQIGLVIVDEQHRFGVEQRAKLFLGHSKKLTPHLLTITATPIPRTLALTLYGDLDLSVLDEMPLGRQKISTFVVPNPKRNDAYKFIEKEVLSGRQTFIVTPFVEPSETMTSVKSATMEFGKLMQKFSKKVKLGLLHGRLKSKEKEEIINKFKEGKIDILVATPVVEVGIDVPNATIILIESAERFGLAQLHQLRGRVGRGSAKSYCFLFTDSNFGNSQKRLKSMEKIHVGFELAEIDLAMRGAGEIFGTKQSGFANLKIANLTDQEAVARAQEEAKKVITLDSSIKKYPLLLAKLEKIEPDFVQPN